MSGYRTGRTTEDHGTSGTTGATSQAAPGKRTLVGTVYRKAHSHSGECTPDAHQALDKAGGAAGEPLATPTRGKLESSIGADLSGVRVHTGPDSAAAASTIGASAYTHGNDIHFAAGKYEPAGNHLLAHEVAHTVQQRGSAGTPQAKLAISSPGDSHEVAADHFADAFVSGQSHPVAPASGIQGVVSRHPDGGMDAGVDGGAHRPPSMRGPDAVPNAPNPLAPNAANAPNTCTPETAQAQADAALQQCRADINQTLNGPNAANAPPAAAGPVCTVDLTSRPLNEALSEMMRGQGMSAAQISTVWTSVQRRVAGSFGEFYDIIGVVQRCVSLLLDIAEILDRGGATLAPISAAMRTAATNFLTDQLPKLHRLIKQKIARAAVDAIQSELRRTVSCLADQVEAAVEGALPQSAFGTIDLTSGTTREVRFRMTSQFAAYRTAVQTALETVAGTTFRPFVTGDATGLHMEMLTAADHTTRMAGAGTTLDAGHLHVSGGNAADTQSMAWDVYQMQATSNNGALLVRNMVTGSGQNFDVVMRAVNGSPSVDYDAFISNEVDLADIHAERHIPVAGSSNHPQSQESVYAHFMHERQYDATHSGTNMTTIAATARTLETQRLQLRTDHDALSARVRQALDTGTQPTPPLNAAETALANAWGQRAVAWQTAQTANQAAFDARFNPAHSYAIDQENAYNRERGFDDSRPH